MLGAAALVEVGGAGAQQGQVVAGGQLGQVQVGGGLLQGQGQVAEFIRDRLAGGGAEAGYPGAQQGQGVGWGDDVQVDDLPEERCSRPGGW